MWGNRGHQAYAVPGEGRVSARLRGGREPFSADGMDKGNDLCREQVVADRATRAQHVSRTWDGRLRAVRGYAETGFLPRGDRAGAEICCFSMNFPQPERANVPFSIAISSDASFPYVTFRRKKDGVDPGGKSFMG